MNITNLKKQKNQLIKYSKHDLKKKKNIHMCNIRYNKHFTNYNLEFFKVSLFIIIIIDLAWLQLKV